MLTWPTASRTSACAGTPLATTPWVRTYCPVIIVERAGVENTDGVLTLQTFSFFGEQSPKAAAVLQAYHTRFGTRSPADVPNALSVAQAYDGLHMLAQAIRKAGSVDGPRVRDALEQLDTQDGLVARYAPPFTPANHEALRADSYLMAIWQGGQLLPAPQPRLR